LSKPRSGGGWLPFASVLKPVAAILAEHRADPGDLEEAVRSRKLGYDDGFAQGRAEGYAEGHAQAKQEAAAANAEAVAQFAASVEAVERAFREWRAGAEERIGLLALAAARKAVGREIESGPGAVQDIVRLALDEAVGTRVVRIRVPAHTAALVGEAVPEGVAVVEDTAIESGCVIETDWGELDARCGSFFDRIEEAAA
jgi:flagellar assembly protein FliH